MNEKDDKFINDQVKAAQLAKEIYDKEQESDGVNFDSIALAFRWAELTGNQDLKTIITTAKQIKKYLKTK